MTFEFIRLEEKEQPIKNILQGIQNYFTFIIFSISLKLMIGAWNLEIIMKQLSIQNFVS